MLLVEAYGIHIHDVGKEEKQPAVGDWFDPVL